MKQDRRARTLAAGFFLVWLGILYLGADHPPPLGFVWLVLLDLIAAFLVYRRVATDADWRAARRPHWRLRVLRDGALVGLTFGAVTLVFAVATRGKAVAPGWAPVLLWLGVLTLVGVLNALLLHAFIALWRVDRSLPFSEAVHGSRASPQTASLSRHERLH